MIIFKSKILFDQSNTAFYEGNKFAGVLIEFEEGIVTSKVEYINGLGRVGMIKSPFPIYLVPPVEINGEFLDGVDEPYKYRGDFFSGVAYFFEKDICVAQRQYENGEKVSEAKFTNGNLTFLEHAESDDTFTQKYIWDINGELEHLSISSKDQFHVGIHFEPNQEVSLVIFEGNYFKWVEDKRSLILFDYIKAPSFFKTLKFSSELNLSGSSIDDVWVSNLVNMGRITPISRLELYNTSVTKLDFLESCHSLQELYVESNIILLEEVQAIKYQAENCYVVFNQKVITV